MSSDLHHQDTSPIDTRFIWADKWAAGLAGIGATILGAGWAMAYLTIGRLGFAHLWSHLGWLSVGAAALPVLAAWVLMCGLDFAFGGASHRYTMHLLRGMKAPLAGMARALAKAAPHWGHPVAR